MLPGARNQHALKVGQPIRTLGPASHQGKKGTPTMGGLIIFIAVFFSSALWAVPNVWTVVALLVYTLPVLSVAGGEFWAGAGLSG